MKTEKFDVQGMTCSSCSAHVEKAVRKLQGCKQVQVNLLSNQMVVVYDENILNEEKIIASVIDAGYGANVHNQKSTDIKENKQSTNMLSMKKRLIVSVCFLIPLMYIAMHHMLYMWFGIPIPPIIQTIFDGKENAITFGMTQLLCLLPIVYVNRQYFIVGWKRLLKKAPNMDSLIAIGSSAAILYGIFAIYAIGYGLGHQQIELVEKYVSDLYFESAGTILTLITVRKISRSKIKRKNR